MYLANLQDDHKNLFLLMAQKLAFSDGCFSEEEKVMIDMYCYEMGIEQTETVSDMPVADIVEEINRQCSFTEKRIFVFELIGLAVADQNYDDEERKLINLMMEKFGIDPAYEKECEDIIQKYLEFQQQINELVLQD